MNPMLRRWGGRTLRAAVALFLIDWLGGWIRFTTDPRLAEVIAMQREADRLVAIDGGPKTEAEARVIADAWGKIKEKTDSLPPKLRGQAAAAGWATSEAAKERQAPCSSTHHATQAARQAREEMYRHRSVRIP